MMNKQKKIGIITLYGNYNFGNRLQNYAVQRVLEKRDCSTETLIIKRRHWKTFAKQVKKWATRSANERRRERAVKKFNRGAVHTRHIYNRSGVLDADIAAAYDYLVVGSDQVWNPEIRLSERETFFLSNAQRNQRICIAPSIGTDSIPPQHENTYRIGLDGFPYLCCREENGAELIRNLTGKECQHIIDPTLALTAEEWREFGKQLPISEKYVFMFFLGDIPEVAQKIADEACEEYALRKIVPSDTRDPMYGIDPKQFVWLIDHAELVLTDSFHACAFSINLNTPFYVFDRAGKAERGNKISSRIVSLMELTGMKDRHIAALPDEKSSILDCSFLEANQAIEKERKKFDLYVDKCLSQKDIKPFTLPERRCTGCNTCAAACPTNCIQMKLNSEGFLYPVVDLALCSNCGKCVKTCPVINDGHTDSKKLVYAAYNSDEEEIMRSSSGAVFPLFASKILERGGVVYGAALDDELNVKHIGIEEKSGLDALRFSKYVQSDVKGVYQEIKDHLDRGRTVLFSGTPCQNEGLRAFIGKDDANLLLVDFVCHGVPSPGLWKQWISETEADLDEKIIGVNFRDKEGGDARHYNITYKTENGAVRRSVQSDPYMISFQQNLSLRLSCHECPFKGWKRVSDITIADFWGIDRIAPHAKHEMGTSMLLTHTEKGVKLLDETKTAMHIEQVSETEIEQVNQAAWRSVHMNPYRRAFFARVRYEKIEKAATELYAKPKKASVLQRVIRKIRRELVKIRKR